MVYYFFKHKFIDWKKVAPLVALSVPFAFVGGISLPKHTFLLVLGLTLLVAGVIILLKKSLIKINEVNPQSSNVGQMGIGGGIGFLSGLVGIGGGVFLSPLLYLLDWDTPKKIAANTSLFLLVNTVAGLLGQFSQHEYDMNWVLVVMLLLSVILGGQLGTRVGAKILSENVVRRMTAILVIYVGLKLILENM